jgi:ABC-2 type transport system ATP-binding protein
MSLLDIQQLHRSFGAVHAVNDLNLSVEAGQVYGLVGPDGAGKTTTLRMLCGALLPDSGEIFVDGISAVKQIDQVRRLLGYMPQRFSLYGDLSVGDNLWGFAQGAENADR